MIACLLVLALLGGGVFFLLTALPKSSGGTGSDVPPDALDVAWQKDGLPRSSASSGFTVQWPARWLRGSTLVYGDEHGVRGYDTATGRQKWEVEPPEGAGEPCAMSPEASGNGMGAVLFDSGGDECTYLAAIEVDTGTVVWAKKIPSEYGANGPRVHAGDENITVGLNTVEGVRMFDVRTGAASDPLASLPVKCRYTYVFSARHIVAKPECRDELLVLDTQYGGRGVSVSDQQGRPVKILSDHPLIVAVTVGEGESSPPRVLNFAEDGDTVETVDLTGKASEMVFDDKGNGITGSGLYFGKLRSGGHAVLDLTTGTVVWEGGASVSLIGHDDADDRMLIAEADPGKNYWTRVGVLDPDTGKPVYAGTMVMPDGAYLSQSDSLYAYDTGKVLVMGERTSDREQMIVAFEVDLPAA
ncbi:PQQ-binding-like beta-propeller repeat protein [Streptomyces glaucosporus]|uniref:outer membrane protein assembly factor BamB family protein n=1 Tax=Streptomyces glaucosporus TaxID=284044 RepID=UPI0031D7703D